MIYTRDRLENFIQEKVKKAYPLEGTTVYLKIEALYNETKIWEYNFQNNTLTFDKVGNDSIGSKKKNNNIISIEILDLCGLLEVTTTFSDEEPKKICSNDWKDWFYSKVKDYVLVLDTNFVRKHYAFNILKKNLGEDNFRKLSFRLPRLVILELERQANQGKKGSSYKNLAFYAFKEIDFLKKAGCVPLPELEVSLVEGFSNIAGTEFTDIWIRREIRDVTKSKRISIASVEIDFRERIINPILLTCDLVNALAAEAEDMKVCYFNRIEPEEDKISLNTNDVVKTLTDLFINSAIYCGKIEIKFSWPQESKSYYLEGIWTGKTTYHWLKDYIKVTEK
ncbi:MAG: hypothetical protein QXE05_00220 [Nitrososphaeria archaeon]